jgi:hypothetical protein
LFLSIRVNVPDMRRFQHVNVVFCQLNVSHLWIQGVEGDGGGVGVWGKKGVGKGAVDYQHGTDAE